MTEGTYTTVYFRRDDGEGKEIWVTPRWQAGGNQGTTRRWALENGLAKEEIVMRESVKKGEVVWLSNGVRGFGWGTIEMPT